MTRADDRVERKWPKLPQRALTVAAIAGSAAVLSAAVVFWSHRHARGAGAGAYPNRVVAVVELRSQTPSDKDTWLAPALAEMLRTELSAADEIRVIPEVTVRQAAGGVEAQAAGGYAPGQLAQLRRRLAADYVISGQYRLADSSGDSPLSVNMYLQDARTGVSIAAVSKEGPLSSLNQLVNRLGAELRQKLGAPDTSEGRLNQIASIQPPTTAVAQRIGFALDAIVRHDSARARDELLEAVEEAPDYAPAYLYLSQAWAALGYRQKALAAAKLAADRSSSAPPELRLQIEAEVQRENYDPKHAADSWRTLVALRPSTLEYRLEMIGADIDASDTHGAEAALVDLRRLPEASLDPRTELAASQLARARNDARSQVQHAEEARRLAEAQQTPGLVADAEVALADAQTHLGEFDSAKSELDESIAGYRQMGNPSGEAAAHRLRAAVLENQKHHQEALEEYRRAIALAETIGDAGQIGAVYRNISALLWYQGDREGTRASAQRALDIARLTGDLQLQAWTLRALATIEADEGATEDVLSKYREVTALTERSHDSGGHVWSLATYADILRTRGELDEAEASCVSAEAEADVLSDPQFNVYTDAICAGVAIDRGEADTARLLLEKLALLSRNSGNTAYEGNSEFLAGQIEFDAGRYAEAQGHLKRARDDYAEAGVQTGEANAEAYLALCAQALKQPAERDRAAARARGLRVTITTRQEIYLVDIALARLDAANQRDTVIDRLRKLAADAERRHWIAWSLESKLAEWQILSGQGQGQAPEASAIRSDLEQSARAHGFKRILTLLNTSRQTVL